MDMIYDKKSKSEVSFTEMVLSILQGINRRLHARNWNPETSKEDISIFVQSEEFPYCQEVIDLVEKTFKPKGFICKLEHYSVINGKNNRYNYTFKIKKDTSNFDNLPF